MNRSSSGLIPVFILMSACGGESPGSLPRDASISADGGAEGGDPEAGDGPTVDQPDLRPHACNDVPSYLPTVAFQRVHGPMIATQPGPPPAPGTYVLFSSTDYVGGTGPTETYQKGRGAVRVEFDGVTWNFVTRDEAGNLDGSTRALEGEGSSLTLRTLCPADAAPQSIRFTTASLGFGMVTGTRLDRYLKLQ